MLPLFKGSLSQMWMSFNLISVVDHRELLLDLALSLRNRQTVIEELGG